MEKLLKNGISVAIIGRPNVGKSSLLNAILKEDRAIVTDIEGTTRDTIEEFIQIEGIPLKIVDTAGIRKTDNIIETIGINKSIEASESADLVIVILDSSKKLEKEDIEILNRIENKKGIILLNKIDKGIEIRKEDVEKIIRGKAIIPISALNRTGINELYNKITEMYNLNQIESDDSFTITNERHKQAIINMKKYIKKAKESIKEKMPIDIITINITDILDEIGKITGEGTSEDVITEIFKRFCLGK